MNPGFTSASCLTLVIYRVAMRRILLRYSIFLFKLLKVKQKSNARGQLFSALEEK